MKQGIVLLKELVESWKESNRLDAILLIALCELYLEQPDSYNEGFTSVELVEAVRRSKKNWSDISDPNKCSSDVRNQWKKLLKLWEIKKAGIYQAFNDENISQIPGIDRVLGGGTGNLTKYKILWSINELDKASDDFHGSAYAQHTITYICEDITEPGWFTRLFSKGLEMKGWNRFAYVTTISISLLLGLLGLFLLFAQITYWDAFGTERIFRTFISISLFWLGIWMTVGKLIQLAENKIVAAPWWMQSVCNDRLLEHRHPPRYTTKSIKAVHYTAKCPICNGKVNAVGAKLEFFGRIVGRCENAPIEHVFSFDHYTRSGKSLR